MLNKKRYSYIINNLPAGFSWSDIKRLHSVMIHFDKKGISLNELSMAKKYEIKEIRLSEEKRKKNNKEINEKINEKLTEKYEKWAKYGMKCPKCNEILGFPEPIKQNPKGWKTELICGNSDCNYFESSLKTMKEWMEWINARD